MDFSYCYTFPELCHLTKGDGGYTVFSLDSVGVSVNIDVNIDLILSCLN